MLGGGLREICECGMYKLGSAPTLKARLDFKLGMAVPLIEIQTTIHVQTSA